MKKLECFPFGQLAHSMNEGLVRVSGHCKKRCRRLFWRVKAAVKRDLKKRGKQQPSFQYDPTSYAHNFDDGCAQLSRDEELRNMNHTTRAHMLCSKNQTKPLEFD